ncbi:MAG: DNA repair protein RecO, partial [Candidatus Omnitrophica bacterium]|nr:DNA repair protein RecO [Candidatus Omnitrophota bacterium]
MPIQKSEAIVLKKMDFRDSSLIVTLLARDFGKIKAVVKGVRKEGSGELVHFEVLNHLQIVIYEKAKSELHLMSESSVENPMLSLRNDFEAFLFGCYLADVIDAFYDLHEVVPKIFDSFLETLTQMKPPAVKYRALCFQLAVLEERGLYPGISVCVRCHSSETGCWFWSAPQGGILCEVCGKKESKAQAMSSELVLFLRDFKEGKVRHEMPALYEGHLLWDEAELVIREFITLRAESPLKSAGLLKHIPQALFQ